MRLSLVILTIVDFVETDKFDEALFLPTSILHFPVPKCSATPNKSINIKTIA